MGERFETATIEELRKIISEDYGTQLDFQEAFGLADELVRLLNFYSEVQ